MDELLAAYQATNYRVRLARGGYATIKVDRPLPVDLLPLVGAHSWGFITAWNPLSQPISRQLNRQPQRLLLRALRECPGTAAIYAALGVGSEGPWKEPSLFVVGPEIGQLDPLAQCFGQNAYVHGRGDGPAFLRWTREQL
jgi:hypothetical protein